MGLMDFVGGAIGSVAPFASTVLGMSGTGGNIVNGLLGSVGAGIQQNAQASQQYQYQLALQHDAQAWNEKMWNMNNEYNTPLNQVKRLQEGGLNANLAYGSLSGNVAQPASAAGTNSMGRYQTSTEIQSARLAMANQMMQNAADLKVKEAQANLINEQAATEDFKRQNLAKDTDLKDWQAKSESENYYYLFETHPERVRAIALKNKQTVEETERIIAETSFTRANEIIQKGYFALKQQLTEAQIADLHSQIQYRSTMAILEGRKVTSTELLNESIRHLNFSQRNLNNWKSKLDHQLFQYNADVNPYKYGEHVVDYSLKRRGYTFDAMNRFVPKVVTPLGNFSIQF